jgi:hypothetical protein
MYSRVPCLSQLGKLIIEFVILQNLNSLNLLMVKKTDAETKILEGCSEIPLCNLHELSICQQVTKARGHRTNNLVFLVKEFLTQYGHSTVNSFSELNLLSFDWPQNHAMFQQLLGLDNDHKDSRNY